MLKENHPTMPGEYIFGTSPWWALDRNVGLVPDWTVIASPDARLVSDPLRALIGLCEFRSKPYNMIESAGLPADLGDVTHVHLGHKPTVDPQISRLHKLQTIAGVLSFLQGGLKQNETARSELTVGHFNIVGEVTVHNPPDDNLGASPNKMTYKGQISNEGFGSQDYYVLHANGSAVTGSGVTPPIYRVEAQLPELKASVAKHDYDFDNAFPGYNWKVSGLSWRTDVFGNVDRVFYRVENTAYGNPGDGITNYLWYKLVGVVFDILWISNPTVQSPGVPFEIRQNFGAVVRIGCKVIRHYTRDVGEQPGGISSSASVATPLSAYDIVSTGGADPGNYFTWLCSSDKMDRFHQYIGWDSFHSRYHDSSHNDFVKFTRLSRSYASDFLPAAFFAQGDAVDTGFATLKSNILETIVEIKDYLSPIDLAKDLNKILTSGGTAGSSIWRILDFLANWKLTYSFGYRPTEALAKELSRNISKFASAWRNATRWQTFRGSYRYLVGEDDPPFPMGTVINGHSKIRVRIPPDSILPMLLPAESLSLLPSLSRVWDILPYSSIADWFFNISGKLEVVDLTQRLMLLQIAYVVNSTKVISPFPEVDQEDFGFVAKTGADMWKPQTGYVSYSRYVLPTYQVFTPTRFGFVAGQGVPDYWLAGALLFKLFT